MSPRSRATDIGPEGKAWPLSRVLSPHQPPDLPFQTPSCLSCFLEKYSWPCVEFPHSDSNVLAQTFQRHGINSEQDDQACSLQTVEDMKMLVIQSCPILCDLMDCCPPGSSVHGILQARILEWVAIPSSRGSSRPRIEPRSPHCRQILYHLNHRGLVQMGLTSKLSKSIQFSPTQSPIRTLPEDRFPLNCMEKGAPHDKKGMMALLKG